VSGQDRGDDEAQRGEGLNADALMRRAAERGLTIPPDRIDEVLEGARALKSAVRRLEFFEQGLQAAGGKP
jgi:hypothetical protein